MMYCLTIVPKPMAYEYSSLFVMKFTITNWMFLSLDSHFFFKSHNNEWNFPIDLKLSPYFYREKLTTWSCSCFGLGNSLLQMPVIEDIYQHTCPYSFKPYSTTQLWQPKMFLNVAQPVYPGRTKSSMAENHYYWLI
jgi:hypothetical protein